MPMAMQAWMPQPSTFLRLKVDVSKDGSLVGSERMNTKFVSLVATQTVQT